MTEKIDNFKIFSITAVLLFCVPYFVLPNLFTDLKNLKSETKILKSTEVITERNYSRSLPQKYISKLVMTMNDGSTLHSSEEYDKYWSVIQKKDNIGKKIKYYYGVNSSKDGNPLQLEINNKIIYKKGTNLTYAIALIVLTVILSIISVIKLRNILKNKQKKTCR